MPKIPTQKTAFPHNNPWNITDGEAEVDLSITQLLHAAIYCWKIIHEAEERFQLDLEYPEWAGDGIVFNFGDMWLKGAI